MGKSYFRRQTRRCEQSTRRSFDSIAHAISPRNHAVGQQGGGGKHMQELKSSEWKVHRWHTVCTSMRDGRTSIQKLLAERRVPERY